MNKALFTGLLTVLSLPAAAQAHTSCLPPMRKSAPERSGPEYIVAPGSQKAPAEALAFNAACMFQNGWSADHAEFGIYSLPSTAPYTYTAVTKDNKFKPNGMAGEFDGKYVVCEIEEMWGILIDWNVRVFNTEDWSLVKELSPKVPPVALDMTYDAVSDNVYAAFHDPETGQSYFGTLDTESFTPVKIKDWDGLSSIAADGAGQLWGIDMDGAVVKVDKNTGDKTAVYQTPLKHQYTTSGTIDPATGIYWYMLNSDAECALYAIDLNDGSYTKQYDFMPDEYVGMYIPAPARDAGAPAMPEDVSFTFADGSLSGKVSFRIPEQTWTQAPLTGEIGYELQANRDSRQTLAKGTAYPGQLVTLDVVLPVSGEYTFAITLSNAAGTSPKYSDTRFVGTDRPLPLTGVRLSYLPPVMHLEWDAPEPEKGGYLDTGELHYTVTPFVNGQSQQAFTSDTNVCDINLPLPQEITDYCYSVTMECNGDSYPAVASNTLSVGYAALPYSQTFDTEESMRGFTVLDANNDGSTWKWDSKGQRACGWYNRKNQMDDWLLLPPLELKKGKVYALNFHLYGTRDYDTSYERVEIRMGDAPVAEAMDIEILPVTEIDKNTEPMVKYLDIREDGTYYIGFHGISDADRFYIMLDDISIDAGKDGAVPAPVEALTVLPDAQGALTADISFVAPTVDYAGNQLHAELEMSLKRNDEVIVQRKAAPGEQVHLADTPAEDGLYTYSVTTSSGAGASIAAESTVYVGVSVPANTTSLNAVETATPGEVSFSWEPVEVDVNGRPLRPGTVKYSLMALKGGQQQWLDGGQDLTGTSVVLPVVTEDAPQAFYSFAVFASNDKGMCEQGITSEQNIPVGAPYGLPWGESGAMASIMAADGQGASWGVCADGGLQGVDAQDADNSYFASMGKRVGDTATLTTGKVDLGDARHPALVFWTFGRPGDTATIGVEMLVNDEWKQMALLMPDIQYGEMPRWERRVVALDEFKGKTVCFRFVSEVKTAAFPSVAIDNIKVYDLPAVDLALTGLSAPAVATPGEGLVVNATVENHGWQTDPEYRVVLLESDNEVSAVDGKPMASQARADVAFTCAPTALDSETLAYKVKIEAPQDAVADDNISGQVTVNVAHSPVPQPTSLSACDTADGVQLQWTAPDMSFVYPRVDTEDFERYDAWAIKDLGEWTLLDLDKSAAGGFSGITIPHLKSYEAISFIVFDAADEQLQVSKTTFAAHNGNKYMASVFRDDDGQSDDWLVSPELPGCPQTISFYAKSYNSMYPETFEILYSTTDTDAGSFRSIALHKDIPQAWTQYGAYLPENTKYFAIRCISEGRFALFVDDVTFISESAPAQQLTLKGYNIYMGNDKLATLPADATSYLHPGPTQDAVYKVTALYDSAESRPTVAGVTSLDSVDARISVTALPGVIRVKGMGGAHVTIANPDGTMLYNETVEGQRDFSVDKGIKLVTAGARNYKIVVP